MGPSEAAKRAWPTTPAPGARGARAAAGGSRSCCSRSRRLIAALPAALGGTASAHRQHADRSASLAGRRAVAFAPLAHTSPAVGHRPPPDRPNIVFVLTDDLSRTWSATCPRCRRCESRGMTLTNYFVSDSLCCPSRASIFTGNFPHDTGVFTNTGPQGGFNAFHDRGEQLHSVQRRPAAGRIPHRDDGQIPQRLSRGPGQVGGRRQLRVPGLEPVGRGRLGLSRIRLQAQRRRGRPPLRAPPAGLPDRRARAQGSRSFIDHSAGSRQAVLPRAGDLRAALPVHAGAPLSSTPSPA